MTDPLDFHFSESLDELVAKLVGACDYTAFGTAVAQYDFPVQKLLPFERIARGLAELDDDQDKFRRWLNTPNPELSDFTPLQVIEKGKADAVADMVSSALLGQPA